MLNNEGLSVVFGTGPLGMAVMEELLTRGQSVRMVNRSGLAKVPHGVEVFKADAVQAESARAACRGAGVVYHCAMVPYTRWPEEFPALTNGVLEAAAFAGAKLVYGDNLYMYGFVDGELTEDLPNRATGRKGRTRGEMAETLLSAHASGKVRVTIGRGSDFYGPGVLASALGERVFRSALMDKPADLIGDIDTPHTYIYIKDFARGLVTLAMNEQACGQVFHIPSAETLTTRQMVEMIYQSLGRTPKYRVAPKAFVSLAGLFIPLMRELKETLYQWEHPFVVNHGKYDRCFGSMTTSHPEAIASTVEWYRRHFNLA